MLSQPCSSTTPVPLINYQRASPIVINFRGRKLTDNDLKKELEKSNFVPPDKLFLSNNRLTEKALSILAQHLNPGGKLSQTQAIDLGNNRIYQEEWYKLKHVRSFVRALQGNASLKFLSLAYNGMPRALESEWAPLLWGTQLSEIHLCGNAMTGEYLVSASGMTTCLKTLHICDAKLLRKDGRDLLTWAASHPSLRSIILNKNSLGLYVKGGSVFEKLFLKRAVNRNNAKEGENFIDERIVQNISSTTTLLALHLHETGLTSIDGTKLALCLRDNRSIRNLGIGKNNKIGDAAGAAILEALASRPGHLLINFSAVSCKLGPLTLAQLPNFIKRHSHLHRVLLSGNSLGKLSLHEEEKLIRRVVLQHPHFRRLKLDRGVLSLRGEQIIQGCLRHRRVTLVSLLYNHLKSTHSMKYLDAIAQNTTGFRISNL